MRRGPCFLLLLIVLMTLRGLVGPAMAAGMAMPHGPAAGMSTSMAQVPMAHSGHAEHADESDHAAHAPLAHGEAAGWPACHDDAASGADAAPAATGCAGGTASPHASCADCDICHTAVLVAVAAAAPPPGRQADRAPAAATRFASAGAALAIKPPIS